MPLQYGSPLCDKETVRVDEYGISKHAYRHSTVSAPAAGQYPTGVESRLAMGCLEGRAEPAEEEAG